MPFRTSCLVLGSCLVLAGCGRVPSGPVNEPMSVMVSYPVEQNVTDYAEYTARTAAVDSVEVRARVFGYLDKVNFKEGALVKKGDVLFKIDPRPYKAVYENAVAQIKLNEAQLKQAAADNSRAQEVAKTPGAISKQDLDKYAATEATSQASLAAARANAESARLNFEYTDVISPIDGRVSRYVVTVGNLVQPGDQGGGTLLSTIVSVDPMYAYFDVDEHTALRVRQLIREGKADSPREGPVPVSLGLANEAGHPHQGTINFVENQVNPRTGTIRLRGVFPNHHQVLLPGFFARVRVPIGRPHKALLVSDRALDTDQGQKILYVVNDKNEVVSRPVRVGALHGGLREITEGVKPGEKVIVTGLQQVRPGIRVEAKPVEMPTSEARHPKGTAPLDEGGD